MKKVKVNIFIEMMKLGYIKMDKYNRNYARSKRYRYVQEDVYAEYIKYLLECGMVQSCSNSLDDFKVNAKPFPFKAKNIR
mgnify:CR=1 FL=1